MEAEMIKVAQYLGAALVMGAGAVGAARSQGMVASEACKSIASNKESEKGVRGIFFAAMVLIETAAIYCLLIAIMLVFK